MTLAIPSDWNVLDQQGKRHFRDTGVRLSAGDDKNMQVILEEAESRSVDLVVATKHPMGSPVASNPSIICTAERLSGFPGTKTGKDYLFNCRRILEAGQIKHSFPKQVYSKLLGGVEFHVMTVESPWLGATVRQEYHAAIMKDYALVIVISFLTEEERAVLREALNTLTFSGS
jgi:hypothetical protein